MGVYWECNKILCFLLTVKLYIVVFGQGSEQGEW